MPLAEDESITINPLGFLRSVPQACRIKDRQKLDGRKSGSDVRTVRSMGHAKYVDPNATSHLGEVFDSHVAQTSSSRVAPVPTVEGQLQRFDSAGILELSERTTVAFMVVGFTLFRGSVAKLL
jgi:hypothetical protein